jgi:hypothetical protein
MIFDHPKLRSALSVLRNGTATNDNSYQTTIARVPNRAERDPLRSATGANVAGPRLMFALLRNAVRADLDRQLEWAKAQAKRQAG